MSHILLETNGGIALLTLNRPEKLNAFFGTMREELIDRLEQINADTSLRVAVITGAGRAFCAGGDVEAMSRMQRESAVDDFARLLSVGKKIVTLIHESPIPYLASINGVAAGAGCSLALACDYRIASSGAKMGQTFSRIGLQPDWGGTYFLPRLVGAARALELMVSGRLIDAEEALRLGMIDQVAEPEQLQASTAKLAEMIAAAPSIAVRGIKRGLRKSESNDLSPQLELESGNQIESFRSDDAAEGMNAFFEKRSPKFR